MVQLTLTGEIDNLEGYDEKRKMIIRERLSRVEEHNNRISNLNNIEELNKGVVGEPLKEAPVEADITDKETGLLITSLGTFRCPYCLTVYASFCKDEALECMKTCLPHKEAYEKVRLESPERIRYLMSLGHPNEQGEIYTRWIIMNECERRGKQLFIDLGWPVEPDSIYKNKYTGNEYTLERELYHLVTNKRSFDEMFSIHGWAVIEHNYPKNLWNNKQLLSSHNNLLNM